MPVFGETTNDARYPKKTSVGVSRALRSQLFEVTPTDPLMIAVGTLVLAVVACAAGLLPARRASRVDPAVTLRYE